MATGILAEKKSTSYAYMRQVTCNLCVSFGFNLGIEGGRIMKLPIL
jgi:hypothetical protein